MAGEPVPGARRPLWILVPALGWGGILAELLVPGPVPPPALGSVGCVLGSVAVAHLAFTRKKKDIVSRCSPIFAFMIFIAPLETPPGIFIQVLYAASLTGVAIRLEKKFPP